MSEVKIAELAVRVDNVEAWAEKHERDDDRQHKYFNHMAEDILNRMSGIERSAARFENDLEHRNGHDASTRRTLDEVFERLRTLERLAWIAIGGTGALWFTATFLGWSALKMIGK